MDTDTRISLEFMKSHPMDAARVLESFEPDETARLLERFPAPVTAEAVRLMDSYQAVKCVQYFKTEYAADVISNLSLETASLLLRRVDKGARNALLEAMPSAITRSVKALLRYPEDTAGTLMDPEVFTLPEDITVAEALKRIRKNPRHIIHFIFVVNREDGFLGYINIRELLAADRKSAVTSVMRTDMGTVPATWGRAAILSHRGWREFHAMPVVDRKGILLGVIGYRMLRQLEQQGQDGGPPGAMTVAGSALAELFWVGLSGLLGGATSAVERSRK